MNRTPLKIPVSVALFLLLLTVSPARSEQFPTIRNHYVILIDGSGSNVRGLARRTAFYTMLRDTVTTALFKSGFGAGIPPYDGRKDLLSICDFGIVDGSKVKKSAAREALARYNFKNDFIHVRAKRQLNWTSKKFKAEVAPRTWYQIQVANWALPLAAMNLRAEDDYLVADTFVIIVTDGEKYEDDHADEETQAFRYGDPESPQWAMEASRDFKQQYTRSGGTSLGKPSGWSRTIVAKDGKARVFAEL